MGKKGGYGMGMMPGNMNNLMKQAQKMQRQMQEQQKAMQEQQEELEKAEFSASAGGGAVNVKVSGKKELVKVTIDPEAVDPDDMEMLEDMIVAAANEALRQVDAASQEIMGSMAGGIPGLDIPGFGI